VIIRTAEEGQDTEEPLVVIYFRTQLHGSKPVEEKFVRSVPTQNLMSKERQYTLDLMNIDFNKTVLTIRIYTMKTNLFRKDSPP
jgi:hypothetical protein